MAISVAAYSFISLGFGLAILLPSRFRDSLSSRRVATRRAK